LSGQELSIAGLSPGVYCFVSTADPNDVLIERSNSDNAQSIRLTLSDTNGNDRLDALIRGPAGC
jgi:hypothetical protein